MTTPQTAPISLTKGQSISLTKLNGALKNISIELGWKANGFTGADFDLDASAIMVNDQGKVRSNSDFLYYGVESKQTPCGSIKHSGDNKTGDGDGEKMTIDLSKIPLDIQKVVFVVSIYHAKKRAQNFGQVTQAYIKVVNLDNPAENLPKYDLSEDASQNTSVVFAELYRHEGEWKFRALGNGFDNGLAGVGNMFGLPLQEEA